ncbi:VOC family protein [Streptomyces sp. DSM 15324]|uniref:VOC family protein n=1 Tax=Streptomyces sp. DSM 15324 TaxID=1739111 RepID=UPI0007465914|nr:VOC family protein [Streptomyces sp. DSM 15324]KUO10304.1 dioxygenase [Streptomyces sp. DSM 15324]
MTLHGLRSITIGVPDVPSAVAYYVDFGLTHSSSGNRTTARLSTTDGGEQLELVHAPRRHLASLTVGVDDADDLDRATASLTRLGVGVDRSETALVTADPVTGVQVRLEVAPRLAAAGTPAPGYNAPGDVVRDTSRAPGVLRETRVRPRKLGHVVFGSTDQPATERFFTEGLGFKVSDRIPPFAAFLRCSTDHHNVLVQQAPFPLLHHTSWQVDDVDEVGRGASAMLAKDPARHVWGLGRHHIGSNFFWYLKDPAGNFSEYYADMDCIVDDQLWTPQDWTDSRALYSWGPPPPPSFLEPEDLAELMIGSHSG